MSEFDPPPAVDQGEADRAHARARRSRCRKIKAATVLLGAAVLVGGGTAFGNWLAEADEEEAAGPASSRTTAPCTR